MSIEILPASFAVQFEPQEFPLCQEDVCFPVAVFHYQLYNFRYKLNMEPVQEYRHFRTT